MDTRRFTGLHVIIAVLATAVVGLVLFITFGKRPVQVQMQDIQPPKANLRQDVDIKLNSTRELKEITRGENNEYPLTSFKPDTIFIVANVTVTFKGNSGALSLAGFHVEGNDGKRYLGSAAQSDMTNLQPLRVTLSPGESVTGDIYFSAYSKVRPEIIGIYSN